MAVIKRKSALAAPLDVVNKTNTLPTKPTLSLPMESSSPSGRLQDYIMLFYGEKKIGKTSTASKFSKTFFLMCESGAKALSIFQRPVTSWAEFKGYISLIRQDKRFDTVVVDTADLAYNMCFRHVCQKLGVEHPSDEEWGKGWAAIKDEFNAEINRLTLAGKGVIFISHSTDREIKTRSGLKYHRIMPTVGGQAREILESIVDVWVYFSYDDKKRVMVVEGDDHVSAGHRLETRFQYPNGERIREIPMGSTATEAHGNFVKAFNNQLQKPGKALVLKKSH